MANNKNIILIKILNKFTGKTKLSVNIFTFQTHLKMNIPVWIDISVSCVGRGQGENYKNKWWGGQEIHIKLSHIVLIAFWNNQNKDLNVQIETSFKSFNLRPFVQESSASLLRCGRIRQIS
jgi:hypothetical protein